MSRIPLIGITMGDPAGIGPEIIAKALADESIYTFCRPVVLGDSEVFSSIFINISNEILLNLIKNPSDAVSTPGKIDLINLSNLKGDAVRPGKPTLEGGKAMVEYIFKAVDMIQMEKLDAMVTCPISKFLMRQAGFRYDGHTQLISHLTNTDEYVMMLAGEHLRVALATIHCSIKDVPGILTTGLVYKTIAITARALREDFGFKNARLAVASLNPHASESGLFGSEEKDIIEPAVKRAKNEGFQVSGPFPADTLFHRAVSGQFDAVVAMYHDQGLIPLKLLHFSDAVNVTLGLPIIRTSVDHGTAYDIAGTGQADPSSLKAAIKLAARMIGNRKASRNGR